MDSDSERSLKVELGRQRLERYRQKKQAKSRKGKKAAASAHAADAIASGSDNQSSSDVGSISTGASVGSGGDVAGAGILSQAATAGDDGGTPQDLISDASQVTGASGRSIVEGDAVSTGGHSGALSTGELGSGSAISLLQTSNDISPAPYDDDDYDFSSGGVQPADAAGAAGFELDSDDLLARASDILADHSTDVSESSAFAALHAKQTGMSDELSSALDEVQQQLQVSEEKVLLLEERLGTSEQQLEDRISEVQDLKEVSGHNWFSLFYCNICSSYSMGHTTNATAAVKCYRYIYSGVMYTTKFLSDAGL